MHNKNSAVAFIVLLGIVSLFSDMTHEAATSIKGAYLLIFRSKCFYHRFYLRHRRAFRLWPALSFWPIS